MALSSNQSVQSEPPPSPLANEINATIRTFKNKLVTKELEELHCGSLSELQVVISRIQHEQRTQKKMMNFNRIKGFLEAMDQFEGTIKVFVNASDYVAFIWGPIKLLLTVSNLATRQPSTNPIVVPSVLY
jgi:molecular chaperone GrpE (heat shock protein)